MELIHGSLFSGIGGFDLAFERAGFTSAFQVENDPKCIEVLERYWPDVPRWGDIEKVCGTDLPACDVLTFGSPCQDLSVAGKREGLGGVRSGLFHEATRVIREMRNAGNGPTIVVWENVFGALSSNNGLDFAAVLDSLAELGALDIGWAVLDGRYFGIAQRRRRVFVVVDFGGQRAGAILPQSEGVCGDLAPGGEEGEDIAGTLGGSSQSGGFRTTDLDNNGAFVVADTVRSHPGPGSNSVGMLTVAHSLNAHPGRFEPTSETLIASAVAIPFDEAQITSPDNRSNPQPGDPAPTLAEGGRPAIAVPLLEVGARSGPAADDPRAGAGIGADGDPMYTAQATKQHGIWQGGGIVRRLTPKECARLQGFPDDWGDWQADSHRYKQFGNAVAVPVAQWIAGQIAVTQGEPALAEED